MREVQSSENLTFVLSPSRVQEADSKYAICLYIKLKAMFPFQLCAKIEWFTDLSTTHHTSFVCLHPSGSIDKKKFKNETYGQRPTISNLSGVFSQRNEFTKWRTQRKERNEMTSLLDRQSQPAATTAYRYTADRLPSCGWHARNYWN